MKLLILLLVCWAVADRRMRKPNKEKCPELADSHEMKKTCCDGEPAGPFHRCHIGLQKVSKTCWKKIPTCKKDCKPSWHQTFAWAECCNGKQPNRQKGESCVVHGDKKDEETGCIAYYGECKTCRTPFVPSTHGNHLLRKTCCDGEPADHLHYCQIMTHRDKTSGCLKKTPTCKKRCKGWKQTWAKCCNGKQPNRQKGERCVRKKAKNADGCAGYVGHCFRIKTRHVRTGGMKRQHRGRTGHKHRNNKKHTKHRTKKSIVAPCVNTHGTSVLRSTCMCGNAKCAQGRFCALKDEGCQPTPARNAICGCAVKHGLCQENCLAMFKVQNDDKCKALYTRAVCSVRNKKYMKPYGEICPDACQTGAEDVRAEEDQMVQQEDEMVREDARARAAVRRAGISAESDEEFSEE